MTDLTAADWVTIGIIITWLSVIATLWNAEDDEANPVEKILTLGPLCSIIKMDDECIKIAMSPSYRIENFDMGGIIRLDTGAGENTRHVITQIEHVPGGAFVTLSGGL